MASSRRSGAVLAALIMAAGAARAQHAGPLVLEGRALRVRGPDTTGLGGATVVAHRIGMREQGPIDTVATDRAGRFRFVIQNPDTAALYVMSTRHDDVGYFASPIGVRDRAAARTIVLPVYDTSTTGSPLAIAVRHLVVTAPGEDGARGVLDIIQVTNPDRTTRIARDSLTPTWRMRLPAGIRNFQLGQGEVSASAVRRVGDTLLVAAPFPPGDKQVVVNYALPSAEGALAIPIDQPTARLELLVEDSNATASGPGVRSADPMTLEGRAFTRFTADGLAAGAAPEVRFRRRSDLTRRMWWVAVLVAGLALAAGIYLAARGPAPARTRDGVPDLSAPVGGVEPLVAQIVALDERYAGKEAETAAEEWAGYQARRAELKARIGERLARS